jgi:AI-2 transport protein TqsA
LKRFGVDPAVVAASLSQVAGGSVGSMLLATANALLGILSQGMMVMIFLLFLLLGRGDERRRGLWDSAERSIRHYIVTKAAISAATGFSVGAVLMLLNIDLAIVFGMLAFLLNFIPSVGSVIATLLPLPVIIASPTLSATEAVLAIAIPGVIQFAIGNFAEAKVLGEALDLHPVAILMNLIGWGMLWGLVGMLLSTPILVVIKILCEKFEATQVLAALLAGRTDAFRR